MLSLRRIALAALLMLYGLPAWAGSTTFTAQSNNTEVTSTGAAYPPPYNATTACTSQTALQPGRYLQAGNYNINQALLCWDTSSLTNAVTVTGAQVQIYVNASVSVDGLGVVMDWVNWTPCDSGDLTSTAPNSALLSVPISSIPATSYYTLCNGTAPCTLQGLNNISLTGTTCARMSVTCMAGGCSTPPTGINAINFATTTDSSHTAAQLIVDWTSGGTPTPSFTPTQTPTITPNVTPTARPTNTSPPVSPGVDTPTPEPRCAFLP